MTRHPDESPAWGGLAQDLTVRHHGKLAMVSTSAVAQDLYRECTPTPPFVAESATGVVRQESATKRFHALKPGAAIREARRRFWHLRHDTMTLVRRGVAGTTRRARRLLAPAATRLRSEAQVDASIGDSTADPTPPSVPSSGDVVEQRCRRLAELERRCSAEATSGALFELIKVLHEDGQLTRPSELIAANQDLVESMTATQRRMVRRVSGQYEAMRSLPMVPARQSGSSVRVDRGRIMYCAHATPPFQSNGYAIRTRGLLRGMTENGTDVFVAARPGYPWDVKTSSTERQKTSVVRTVDGIDYLFSYGPDLGQQAMAQYIESAVDSYLRAIERERPEHVHAASNHLTALPALIAARLAGLSFTYEVRGFWENGLQDGTAGGNEVRDLFGRLETLVMSEADHIFVLSPEMEAELHARGIDPKCTSVTPNGVDPSVFQPLPRVGDAVDRMGLREGRTVIGYAGSMVDYEGLDLLVEACQLLAAEREDFQLVLAGDGPVLPDLKQRLSSGDDRLEYTLTGRLPADSMPLVVSAMDIIACPRKDTPVTRVVSPLKPLEAFSAGVPVVMSDLPVLTSLAEESGSALLFPAGDVEHLAARLRELLDAPDERRRLGRRGRDWVRQRRQWTVIAEDITDRIGSVVVDQSRMVPQSGRDLSSFRIGLIADVFTTQALRETFDVVPLRRDGWAEQLAESPVDVVFVESAWKGNNEDWHRGVGHYSDEESAALRALLDWCRDQGVHTVFWNKEDPVHFNRFIENARLFDQVLTTDNRSIPRYQERLACSRGQQVASMPFFAQPTLHHPVAEQVDAEHPMMFAGSYYGDRYADRSKALEVLLDAARPFGLLIYDRQADDPDSPYRFPEHLQSAVNGGLNYPRMVEAYREHPVHLNVNSVTRSETMFSRRVVEIGSSGGLVMSGASSTLRYIFRGLIATVKDGEHARQDLDVLFADPEFRNVQGWNLRRLVRRSHSIEHRLTVVLRRAGFQVNGQSDTGPVVSLISETTDPDLASLADQTLRPRALVVLPETVLDEDQRALLAYAGIAVHSASGRNSDSDVGTAAPSAEGKWHVRWDGSTLDRAVVEDLVTLAADTGASQVALDTRAPEYPWSPLATWTQGPIEMGDDTVAVVDHPSAGEPRGVIARRGLLEVADGQQSGAHGVAAEQDGIVRRKIVVAGHDLKFAGDLIEALRRDGHEVRIDPWQSHTGHDVEESRSLVEWADVVFCEWGLGNAVWYSKNKREGQRLVVRVHLQEIFTSYFTRMRLPGIDQFIHVAPHVQDAAAGYRGVSARPNTSIPNVVTLPPDSPAEEIRRDLFALGLVGIVPQRKGLHLALDLLAALRAEDKRFSLRIKGRRPEEYLWLQERAEELAYYQAQQARIDEDPLLRDAVHFDGFSRDRAELEYWYRSLGFGLSVSDFESFHYTLVDSALNGAVPVSLDWAGADRLYPDSWLYPTVREMGFRIFSLQDELAHAAASREAQTYVREHFDPERVLRSLIDTIVGNGASEN